MIGFVWASSTTVRIRSDLTAQVRGAMAPVSNSLRDHDAGKAATHVRRS